MVGDSLALFAVVSALLYREGSTYRLDHHLWNLRATSPPTIPPARSPREDQEIPGLPPAVYQLSISLVCAVRESITDSADGFDLIAHGTELFSQARHVDVDRSIGDVEVPQRAFAKFLAR